MKFCLSREDRGNVIKIVAAYSLFGGLWIYLSDSILGLLVRDPDIITRIATYKGLVFIATTAALLYYLIGRYVARISEFNRQLKESEDRFQTIFNNVADAVFIHEPETGRILDINRTACAMFGYTHAEMLALELNDISLGTPPFSQQEALEWLRRAAQGEPQTFSWYSRRHDGTFFWTEVSMQIASIGGVARIIVSVRDISERKTAELALRESEENLRSLLELMPVGVVCAGHDGVTEYLNPNFIARFGYTLVDIPTCEQWFQAAYPDGSYRASVLASWETQLNRARSQGVPMAPHDVRVTCKDGTVRRVIINTQLSQQRILSIFTDITERENQQEELIRKEKLESIGVLAGGIAHDFNNVLTGILGNISYAGMFLDQEHKAMAPLLQAEKASKRAAELAHQLLTFAKGGQPVTRSVEARQIIEESLSLVLHGSNVNSRLAISEGLHAIEADAGQISQAFNNLIINAVQAMPGGGTISIRAENFSLIDSGNPFALPTGEYVRFIIEDNGCGIPPETLHNIFDPYFTTKARGSGLGLASVQSIIGKHGGHIGVRSAVGRGTIFDILLPASKTRTSLPSCPVTPVPAPSPGSCSLLVMDDEEMIRDLATCMLEELGYRVTNCASGEEAVALYRAARDAGDPFSAVIMDLTIPGGMGGEEAARRILDVDPHARLIVSSGYSNDPIVADYRTYGFSGAVVKPYSVTEIAETLNNLLAREGCARR